MTVESCRMWRGQLASWVLGQLEGAEAEELMDHLAGCAACQEEAAELTEVAAALRAADPARMGDRQEPPAALHESIAGRIAHERAAAARGHRRRWLAAAAAVVVLLGAAATVAAWPEPERDLVAVQITETVQGLAADVGMRDYGWGASLYITADGFEEGAVYRVWVEDRAGARQPAGSFLGVADREIRCVMAAATRLEEAAVIGIDGPGGSPVLRGRVPPLSG